MKMDENFKLLNERIYAANRIVTRDYLIDKLKDIKGTLITTGSGGSYPVSHYASLIMEDVNKCFVRNVYPRGVNRLNPDCLMTFSYSGFTPSILQALQFTPSRRKILFTTSENNEISKYENICYGGDIEHSFISIASTFIPMSLLYNYGGYNVPLETILEEPKTYDLRGSISDFKTVEIFSGVETNTAAYVLQSGLVESGMAYSIVHEKNNYAHGCATLNYKNKTDLCIYLVNDKTEYDTVMEEVVLPNYDNVIVMKSIYSGLIAEFDLALKAMYLLRDMATIKDIDLSLVDSPKSMKKIYSFNGKMV